MRKPFVPADNHRHAPSIDASRPSAVRRWVVGMATLMAVLLYLDRYCLSFAEQFIAEELSLNNQQVARLLSAFFFSYALGQVPAGWLSDRFGGRLMLAGYIIVWSLFTALMGFANGFIVLLVIRLGIGLGQAGAYPTSAGLISKWVPFGSRGLASGIVSFGGRIGGFLAPIVTAYMIVAFVPVSTPSLLTAGDLRNPRALCSKLLSQPDESQSAQTAVDPERRALERDVSQQVLSAIASGDRQILTAGAQYHAANSPMSQAQIASLAAALNAALADPQLCRDADLQRLAKREAELVKLAAQPRESLSTAQVQRLNRLFLEAVYPDQIKKLYGRGWRPVFIVYGLAGLLVAVLFWMVVRDRPSDHPGVNAAELQLITGADGAAAAANQAKAGTLPMSLLLSNFSLWMSCVSQFFTNFGWLFLTTWVPRYLLEVHEVPTIQRGWMSALPISIGWIGMLGGGWLTDFLVRRTGLKWGRRWPMCVSRFTAMAAYLVCLFEPSAWVAVAAFCIVALSTDIGTPAVWAFNQDIGGRYTGSVLGWGNMWGNLGAFASPLLLGYVLGEQGNWKGVFLASAAAFLVSGIAASLIDATSKLIPDET